MNRRHEEEENSKVTLHVAPVQGGGAMPIRSKISGITSIVCQPLEVKINSQNVPLSGGSIELEEGKNFDLAVRYKCQALGSVGYLDSYYIGVTARMGSQKGWDPTRHTGGGEITNQIAIGNLQGPSSSQTLQIKIFASIGGYEGEPNY
jgi:hypothetical protein